MKNGGINTSLKFLPSLQVKNCTFVLSGQRAPS